MACPMPVLLNLPIETNGTTTFYQKLLLRLIKLQMIISWSVSQSGNILVVGTYLSDPDGLSNAGAAYIYQLKQMEPLLFYQKLLLQIKWQMIISMVCSTERKCDCCWFKQIDPNNIIDAGAAIFNRIDDNGTVVFLGKLIRQIVLLTSVRYLLLSGDL